MDGSLRWVGGPAAAWGPCEAEIERVTTNEGDQPQTGAVQQEPGPAPEGPPRQSIGRNVASTLAAQMVSWLLAFVTVTQLPRYLGAEDVGLLRVATALWLVAGSFAGFGTDRSVTLQAARSEDEMARIMAAAVRLRLILTVAASIIIAGVLTAMDVDQTLAVLMLIGGVGAVGRIVGTVATASLRGLENFSPLAKVTTFLSLFRAVGVVLGIVLDIGLYPLAMLLAVSEILGGVLRFRALRKLVPLGWRTTNDQVKATAKRGLPYLLGAIALTLYHEADTVVMAVLVDAEQIGWYSSADRLFGNALIVPTTLMATMLPVLARVHATDPTRAATMAEQTYRTLLMVGVPSGLGLYLISDRMAVVMFGGDFEGSGPVLAALGPVLAMVSITILIGRYAVAIGREKIYYTMLLAAAAATVPLDLVLVPFFDERYQNGAIGGAVSFAITEALLLTIGTAVLLPSAVSSELAVRAAKVVAASVVMGAAVYPLRDLFPVFPIAVGAVVFVVATALLRTIEPHEREMAAPLLQRVRRLVPSGN